MLLTLIRTTRPPFLVLTPVCVFLGVATVAEISRADVICVLVGALLAHIGVNCLNEYQDFRSGLDLITERTPFSGGSGGLAESPQAAPAVLGLAVLSVLGCLAIGLWLTLQVGWSLALIGSFGLLLVITYTRWLNQLPWICLVAPGLGFGPLIVLGSYLAVGGQEPNSVWLVSLVPFFLVNNLLLLNQFPDMAADSRVGRRTLPIVYGTRFCVAIYTGFALMAYTLIGFMILSERWPVSALLCFVTLPLAAYSGWKAWWVGATIKEYPSALAVNVLVVLVTPSLLAWGLRYG